MSRRGLICSVWSDNDSDFVGANNELKKALKEMKLQKMKTFLQEKPAEWILTHQPIRSPLYGSSIGMPNLLWRIPFRRIVRNTVTCGMVTLMTEVKSIINSRPLIMVKLMPLPPRNLLTMKTNVGMPPPVEFSRPNLYSERGWYCVQHIANSGTDGEKNFPRSSNLNITGKQRLKFQNWEYCIAKGWRPLQSVVFGKSHQC